jgi:hypothetical protein
VLTLGLGGCGDRSVPDRASGRPTAAPAASAETTAPADPDDPAEPGITDLARLARYVFRAMQEHEAVCSLENPFRDKLSFAFAIDVAGGRITRVGVAEAAIEAPLGRLALLKRQWPPELPAYVACLAPHLQAIVMDPAPADGAYQPFYSYAGRPGGQPLP